MNQLFVDSLGVTRLTGMIRHQSNGRPAKADKPIVRQNHFTDLRSQCGNVIDSLSFKGPALTQLNRFIDLIESRGWSDGVQHLKGYRMAIVRVMTGDPISKSDADARGLNLLSNGIPAILLGQYRDGLLNRDKALFQEILTQLSLDQLTPEYKNPDVVSITEGNPANQSLKEANEIVRAAESEGRTVRSSVTEQYGTSDETEKLHPESGGKATSR